MPRRAAWWLCGAALVIGLVGDQLLRPAPWGAGAAAWLLLSIGTALAAARAARRTGLPALTALLLTAACFAMCLAWRDATSLKGWNVLACCAALTLGLLQLGNLRLRATGLVDYVAESASVAFRAAVGPIVLLGSDLIDRATGGRPPHGSMRAVVLGILVAIPIIIVFGALLASADPVFERLTRFLVDWDFERLLSHVIVIGIVSWLAAGYLRSVVVAGPERSRPLVALGSPTWGAVEIGIPLAALAVLFLAFVVVQARYLFGGEDLIRSAVGLTYAEYARRGFFELVTVAGLVLPLLMAGEWSLKASDRSAARVFRILATLILLLVGLIIASAAIRLRLYRAAYGLTQDRLYAAAVMVWIAGALAWFGTTVLRGHRKRFVFGAIIAGFAVVAGMNVLNPDAVIARANLLQASRGHELDARYLERLSADATPALAAALASLALPERCALTRHLAEQYRERQQSDWRSWSLGRSRADGVLGEVSAALGVCGGTAVGEGDARAPSVGVQ